MAIIWETTDRLGRLVVLNDEGWSHIVDRHGDLLDHQREILEAIEFTDEVVRDAQYAHRAIHYRRRPSGPRWIRVVVQYRPIEPAGWVGRVITAHFLSIRPPKRGPDLAISKQDLTQPVWANPIWPDPLPEPDDLRLVYGAEADELVVLFRSARHSAPVFDFIDTPDVSYSAVKIDTESGAVIGVLVYPLAAFAVECHPDWCPALAPNPSTGVASRIVRDVKHLYDHYGLVPDDSAPE